MSRAGGDWFKGAKTNEEKEAIYAKIIAAEPAFSILREILRSRKTNFPSVKEKDYIQGDWVHLQAHRNGRIEEDEYLLKLLTIKEQ